MPENRSQKELITRIDERTLNIWRTVEVMEKHLIKLNDRTRQNETDIAINTTNVSSNRGMIYKIGIPVCLAIIGLAGTLILKIAGVF